MGRIIFLTSDIYNIHFKYTVIARILIKSFLFPHILYPIFVKMDRKLKTFSWVEIIISKVFLYSRVTSNFHSENHFSRL